MAYSKRGSVRPTGRKGREPDDGTKKTKPMPFEKGSARGEIGPKNRQDYGKKK